MAVGKDKVTGKWYTKFRYHDYSGKSIQKRKIGFKTKKEAQKWEDDFKAMHEGKERLTFAQAYERYVRDSEMRLKRATVSMKKAYYKHYESLYDMAIADITPSTIRNFQNRYLLKMGDDGKLLYRKRTIKNINGQLGAFFSWCCKFCGLRDNPVKRSGVITIKDTVIKPNVTRNIWQLADFKRFIDSVERSDYHLIYSILFFCGLRRGECLGLRIKDVDLENGVLHIEQNKTIQGMDTPKTKSSRRTVALPSNIIAEMREFIKRKYKPAPSELVFSLSPDRITKFFVEKQEELNMQPRLRVHDLRHSHASMLINLGFSPDVIADRLGHKDASMVMMVYGHMYPQKRIEVIDALNKAVSIGKKRKTASKK